jgi:hypothetical protein
MLMMGRGTLAPAAVSQVEQVRRNDHKNSWEKQVIFIPWNKLFRDQENKAQGEYENRHEGAMMLYIAVVQRIAAHQESNTDHCPLKQSIMNDIGSKQWETG